jgi:hypothetical protein
MPTGSASWSIARHRRIGLHETHPLFAASRHPAFGSVLADEPKSKNAKVTLVYEHELPNDREIVIPDK